MCRDMNYKSEKIEFIQRHLNITNSKNNKSGKYMCRCKKTFETKIELLKHIKEHNND